jgi:hypothetical protein
MKPKWLVMCIAASLLLLAVVGLTQDFDAWTWLLVALLAVCPLIVLWVTRRMQEPSDQTQR